MIQLSKNSLNDPVFAVRCLLSLALLLYAAGIFYMVFAKHQTHFGNYLFLILEMTHRDAVFFEKISVSVFLLFSILSVIKPQWYFLLPTAAYIFFESWAGYFQAGYRYSEYTLFAFSLRYITPMALLALFSWPLTHLMDKEARLKLTGWILRLGIAIVFIMHGLECLWAYPPFIDLIIGSARNLLGINLSEAMTVQVMRVIGMVDIMVGILVLIRPWKALLLWLAFWGGITAFSRMTALGHSAFFEVMLRGSHFLAPLALYVLVHKPQLSRIFNLRHRYFPEQSDRPAKIAP